MKQVKVLIPFKEDATGIIHKADSEIELPDKTIVKLQAINPNMVLVLGEAKKTRAKAKKE